MSRIEPAVFRVMAVAGASLPRLLADLIARGDLVVPPYPAAALRLRRIVQSDDFSLADVADAAAADPALAAALLRVANSPLYHSSGTVITTLGRAVHRLGARSVASIATAAAVGTGAVAPGPLIDVKYRVWRRCVTCALACQRLANRQLVDPEEAFLAGLLRGFGRCVAVACLEKLLPSLPQKSMSLSEWMEAAEPFCAELAGAVAAQWQLPDELARVITGRDPGGAQSSLAELVGFAERIAGALDHGCSFERLVVEASVPTAQRDAVGAFVQALPSALEALVEPPQNPTSKARKVNAVSKPATMIQGELRACALPVADLRMRRDPVRLTAVAIGTEGLVIEGPKPMQESCIARLSLGEGPHAAEGWFSVVLCVPEHGHFRIEVQPFAPSRELRQFLIEHARMN